MTNWNPNFIGQPWVNTGNFLAPVAGLTFATPVTTIAGIGTAVAYASGDAFGTVTLLQGLPTSGIIQSLIFFDLDNEGVALELWLFRDTYTATADNAAWALTDADLVKSEGIIKVATTDYVAGSSNQVGFRDAIAKSYIAPLGILYCQWVTRGAPNIAAANIPQFALRIIPDAYNPNLIGFPKGVQ